MARTRQPSRKKDDDSNKKPRLELWQRICKDPKWDFERSCMSRLRGEIFRCYQPKFHLSKQIKKENHHHQHEKNPFFLFSVLNHDALLSFLAPHEILALWRCSKETWNSKKKEARRSTLLQSVFGYLRISEEAAFFVHDRIQGGWKSFLPVLVRLCEHMKEAYGDLEPDPAHRAFVAEQCCFHYHCKKRGKLLTYEFRSDDDDQDEDDYHFESDDDDSAQGLDEDFFSENGEYKYKKDPVTGKRRAPDLEKLKRDVGSLDLWWGHSMEIEIPEGWREENHRYMLEHMDDGTQNNNINDHCKERIRRGLDPIIWIMFDNGSLTMHYALGIGPDLQQYVIDYCHYMALEKPSSFYFFGNYASNGVETLHPNGGMVDFLIKSQEMEEGQGSIAATIWCYRHNLEPLTSLTTDYFVALIEEMAQKSEIATNKAKDFYMKALTSELYGPASFEKYKDSVQ